MNELNLEPLLISRPENVLWKFPIIGDDILAAIKSKTTRSFLRTAEERLTEFNISWEHKFVNEAIFDEWLNYYSEKMNEQDYEVLATKEWFQKRVSEGRSIEALFLYRDGKVIGTDIFTVIENSRVVAAFKATERLEEFSKKRDSIGAVIDYLFIKYCKSKGFNNISFGKSRNAFGVINKLGNLDYKLRMGYIPSIPTDPTFSHVVPLNDQGIVLFFGIRESKVILFAAKKKEDVTVFEQSRFATPELPFEILEY